MVGTGVIESCIRYDACLNIFDYNTTMAPDGVCNRVAV